MTDLGRVCANCGTENPAEARFCFSCGAALEMAAAPSAETRKTVTVLFCDLVGSTAMGEQIDPETLRNLLSRSFDRVSAIVESHGGVVEKFIGDAAMAVFGIPRVHEDDALRAVRAAAEIRDALQAVGGAGGGATVAWRTGIATGEVVAGDAAAGSRLVTGDAVNVAARLQQAAQPGEILITAETHQLVRDAVQVEALGEVTVKGRQARIEAFRLIDVDRSAAGHERRLDSPMVGRERPRRLLDEAFAEARDERLCHLFTILGSAGVGKTRLVNEFVTSLGDSARVVHGRCLSYGEGITYWPISEIVRGATGIGQAPGADMSADLARIVDVLGEHDDRDRIAERVGEAIGLIRGQPVPDETPWAIRSFIEALAADRPLVVVLEDLQWAQPLLLDLVEHVADWSRDAPILLIVLARQELLEVRPAWGGGKRSATIISLEPLNAEETAQLIDNLLGQAQLPETIFDRIRSAAEGNPLFVEELLEMLIDEGALARTNGDWMASRDLASLAVPPTIQALLSARLDGLAGTDRAVLERGAVEGTVFHRDAVAALAPEAMREAVGPSLLTLTRREFVAPDRAELAGREAFRFRHQLIRDAAYQAIAKQSRAELHERFAAWLEAALGDRIDEYRPILGYHLEQAARYRRELSPDDPRLADLANRAAHHLGEAGAAALDRGDATAASNLLQRAVTLVDADSPSALPWRLLAGEAMVTGATVEEADAFLETTRAIAENVGDRRSAATSEALRLHARVSLGTEPVRALEADAERLRHELHAVGDQAGAERATAELAKLRFFGGHAASGLELAQELLATVSPHSRIRDELLGWIAAIAYWGPMPVPEALELVNELAPQVRVSQWAANRIARVRGALLAEQGRFDEARSELEAAKRVSEELGAGYVISALQGHFMGPVELLAGNAARAVELELVAFEWMTERGFMGFANTVAAHLGRAMLAMDRDEEAEHWATVARERGAEDDPAAKGPALGIAARVLARRGAFEDAERLGREAVASFDGTDYIDQMATAHVDLADVLQLAGRDDEASDELRVALELYERKGHLVGVGQMRAKLEELRAKAEPLA
ncbi:MAG: adenylate/guanylate cyclase domain-containing protein [Chloroflexota bacterium]